MQKLMGTEGTANCTKREPATAARIGDDQGGGEKGLSSGVWAPKNWDAKGTQVTVREKKGTVGPATKVFSRKLRKEGKEIS